MLPAFNISEHTADTLYWWGNVLVVVGSLVALFGSAVGLLGGIGVVWGDRVRDGFAQQRMTDNEQETARAKRDAGNANQAAGEANKVAGLANKAAGEANERAAGLEKEAATARLELEQIKEKQRPRMLSLEQRSKIVAIMRGAASQSINVGAVIGDTEAREYAEQFKSALEAAGIQVDGVSDIAFSDPVRNVLISVGSHNIPVIANLMKSALDACGIVSTGNLDPKQEKDKTLLLIGTKP